MTDAATRDFRKPRIVLEMQDDGSLVAEWYRNGQRQRETVYINHGILEALGEAKAELAALRAREARKAEDKAAALHRRNYYYAANARHLGVEFANRVITKPPSETERKRAAGLLPPKAVTMSEDLL